MAHARRALACGIDAHRPLLLARRLLALIPRGRLSQSKNHIK
jgi:hypothetical protein